MLANLEAERLGCDFVRRLRVDPFLTELHAEQALFDFPLETMFVALPRQGHDLDALGQVLEEQTS